PGLVFRVPRSSSPETLEESNRDAPHGIRSVQFHYEVVIDLVIIIILPDDFVTYARAAGPKSMIEVEFQMIRDCLEQRHHEMLFVPVADELTELMPCRGQFPLRHVSPPPTAAPHATAHDAFGFSISCSGPAASRSGSP